MKEVKEFHGKTLDEAILAACSFFGVERGKLEIDIVNDSKMGIFGLVNVKKACVRASLMNTSSLLEGLSETLTQPEPTPAKGRKSAVKSEKTKQSKPVAAKGTKDNEGKTPKAGTAKSAERGKAASANGKDTEPKKSARKNATADTSSEELLVNNLQVAASESAEGVEESTKDASKRERSRKNDSRVASRGRGAERKPNGDASNGGEEAESSEGFSLADLASFDQKELETTIHDVVNRLVSAIIGEVPLTIAIDGGHIRVKVDCEEDARILVGREGQTLASVQYIASRILAGKLNGAVRLHIDTGNYKENQDARLTSLALMLAEKLRKSGRTQSTRPLSAYQRRIVHLALEEEEDIQTSSKGDGPQRRVLIHFKRNRGPRANAQNSDALTTDESAVEAPLGEANAE